MAEFAGYLAGYRSFPVLVDGQGAVRWAHHRQLRYVLPTEVILHYTSGGTFDANAIYLTKDNERTVSIHFLIGTGGELAMLCPLDYTAYHAGVWARNVSSIGIELVHPNDDTAYPEPQLMATVQLCRTLCALFYIPTKSIIGHRDVVSTLCPRGLDVGMIRNRVDGIVPKPLAFYKAPTIYGLHEGPADWLGTTDGWITFTANVWEVDRLDYSQLAAQGHSVIVRLNNGYYPSGSIPHMGKYQPFADRCRYVAERSSGVRIWCVGNEANHPQEWPDNVKILPEHYADCYRRVRTAIKSVCPADEVLVASSAPWCALVTYPSNPSGDWVKYLLDVLAKAGDVDGIALHTYTRSHNAGEIAATNLKMDPPFQNRSSNFQCYRDYLAALQPRYAGIPLYITECCPVVSGWDNADRGWVRGAYEEIDRWNQAHSTWPIYCLCLYRGAPHDRWYFGNKGEVRADWAKALSRGYVNWRQT